MQLVGYGSSVELPSKSPSYFQRFCISCCPSPATTHHPPIPQTPTPQATPRPSIPHPHPHWRPVAVSVHLLHGQLPGDPRATQALRLPSRHRGAAWDGAGEGPEVLGMKRNPQWDLEWYFSWEVNVKFMGIQWELGFLMGSYRLCNIQWDVIGV